MTWSWSSFLAILAPSIALAHWTVTKDGRMLGLRTRWLCVGIVFGAYGGAVKLLLE